MTESNTKRIAHFTDLVAWQKAHALVMEIYRTTKTYPQEELYGLSSQSRRAAVSITSNLAEGFGRGTRTDKAHFYRIAKASLAELESQLYVARDLAYVSVATVHRILAQTTEVNRLLGGLARSAQNHTS